MPVVPITSAPRNRTALTPPAAQRTTPPEPFALMAAAQMHAEGRLVEPTPDPTSFAAARVTST